jgi:hypothetical protein
MSARYELIDVVILETRISLVISCLTPSESWFMIVLSDPSEVSLESSGEISEKPRPHPDMRLEDSLCHHQLLLGYTGKNYS